MTSIVHPLHESADRQTFGEPKLHTDGDVQLLHFASDGSLCSVEEPGMLRRWDVTTGRQLEWHALSDLETVWAFSRDGRVLASASDDLTAWDASDGELLTVLAQPSWVTALAFLNDPGFVVTGHDDGVLRCWDVPGHHLTAELRHHGKPISALAISPESRLLAAAGEDKVISLWDLSNGKHLGDLIGHTDRIPTLAWHPSGRYLVSAGWDTSARIWDVARREPAFILNYHSAQVTALAFSADGCLLASADSAPAVHVWDFETRTHLHRLQGPQSEVRSLAFSAAGTRLAANGDRVIHLWEPRSGQPLLSAGPRSVAKTSLALTPDGARLVSNGGGTAPRVWDTVTRKVLIALDAPGPVHAVAVSPQGTLLAGACGDRVRVWDAATGAVRADWDGPTEPITRLAFAPDGTHLASASDTGCEVWLWRVADGEPVLLIPDAIDGAVVQALAFHPDGTRLAVGGFDWLATSGTSGAAALWNVAQRYETALFLGGVTALAFHPSGERLAAANVDQTVCVWNVEDQEVCAELIGHDATITCLAYSPDGKLLASGDEDATLRLWDERGEEMAVLELDSQPTALAFAPDGRALYIAQANTTSRVISLERGP